VPVPIAASTAAATKAPGPTKAVAASVPAGALLMMVGLLAACAAVPGREPATGAIGATRRQVWRTIVAEALLLAALDTAFGILAGLYLRYVFVQGLYSAGYRGMAYTFPLAGVLAAIAAGLIFGVLAALLPGRQASRMEIIKALRYE